PLSRICLVRPDPRRIGPGSASPPSPAEPGRSVRRVRLGYPGSDREGQNRANSADPIPIRPSPSCVAVQLVCLFTDTACTTITL
ncbi:hypothetical protein Taro_008105, partial [Colocasia esculenta]|nr:hypothetical protein [Colocasia esculenta]